MNPNKNKCFWKEGVIKTHLRIMIIYTDNEKIIPKTGQLRKQDVGERSNWLFSIKKINK